MWMESHHMFQQALWSAAERKSQAWNRSNASHLSCGYRNIHVDFLKSPSLLISGSGGGPVRFGKKILSSTCGQVYKTCSLNSDQKRNSNIKQTNKQTNKQTKKKIFENFTFSGKQKDSWKDLDLISDVQSENKEPLWPWISISFSYFNSNSSAPPVASTPNVWIASEKHRKTTWECHHFCTYYVSMFLYRFKAFEDIGKRSETFGRFRVPVSLITCKCQSTLRTQASHPMLGQLNE